MKLEYFLIMVGGLGIFLLSFLSFGYIAGKHNERCLKGLEVTWEPFAISFGLMVLYWSLLYWKFHFEGLM